MDMDRELLEKEEREAEENEVREDEQEKGEYNINSLSPWTLFMKFFHEISHICNGVL